MLISILLFCHKSAMRNIENMRYTFFNVLWTAMILFWGEGEVYEKIISVYFHFINLIASCCSCVYKINLYPFFVLTLIKVRIHYIFIFELKKCSEDYARSKLIRKTTTDLMDKAGFQFYIS